MALIGNDIKQAANLLKQGLLVAIPTETVYGLAANALNQMAVARIFEVKKRPFFDPLIIHLHSIEQVNNYVRYFPENLQRLAKAFWPGPLTILLPKKNIIPDIVTAGLDQVAVRIPNHVLALSLLKELDFPLAAPSANPFGYISPTTAEHVNKQLGKDIDYILNGGACSVGIESTIVGLEEEKVCIYRLGGLTISEIEGVIAEKIILKTQDAENPNSPGRLKSHYAPKKPIYIGNLNQLASRIKNKKIGILAFGELPDEFDYHYLLNLSEKKDMKEAAANLFSCLRQLDESNVDIIICDWFPESGLGEAINDRLKRASSETT